jgi:hypothetical protein
MTNRPEQTLAETRAYSTDEERKVLALEAIADQLRLLVEVLRPVAHPGSTDSASANDRDLRAAGSWENEGGSLAVDTADSFGIKHSVIDQFEIGGYRYSKLDDALAEAKRAGAQ